MKIIGIICEYNLFHLGHKKQFDRIRQEFGADSRIVCLMSGNFVQRGMPAIFDKSLRARAAVDCGADLVLELPAVYALSSAEGFAAGGVKILSPFCDYLCFGSETGDAGRLMSTAKALLSPDFSPLLRQELELGCCFAMARQKALEKMGVDGSLLSNPNDILAVEYCKAILSQNSAMQPFPIWRQGSYHAERPDDENPSATSIRKLVETKERWSAYVPADAYLADAPVHTLGSGERAILARLRTMSDSDFEALPYGSEGLWRKLMHACRECATLEEILTATKSKRYARTRLDRMVMCAFLGITKEILETTPPYTRVLAMGADGIAVLKKARETWLFPHIGDKTGESYEKLEQRLDDLYGLFCRDFISPAGQTHTRRIYLKKK